MQFNFYKRCFSKMRRNFRKCRHLPGKSQLRRVNTSEPVSSFRSDDPLVAKSGSSCCCPPDVGGPSSRHLWLLSYNSKIESIAGVTDRMSHFPRRYIFWNWYCPRRRKQTQVGYKDKNLKDGKKENVFLKNLVDCDIGATATSLAQCREAGENVEELIKRKIVIFFLQL